MALSCPGCLQQPLLAASVSTHQASLVGMFDLLTANGFVLCHLLIANVVLDSCRSVRSVDKFVFIVFIFQWLRVNL